MVSMLVYQLFLFSLCRASERSRHSDSKVDEVLILDKRAQSNIFDDSCSPVSLRTRKIHCLLYADDLVLLSESPQGLQNSLTTLSHPITALFVAFSPNFN
jgi:hypothetical protein